MIIESDKAVLVDCWLGILITESLFDALGEVSTFRNNAVNSLKLWQSSK